jgi:L-amino acid N-acyltransferase YncA
VVFGGRLTEMSDSLHPRSRTAPGVTLRAAVKDDADAICAVFEPAIRAGETYALPRDMPPDAIAGLVLADGHRAFVATVSDRVLGAGFWRANAQGGGDHVANAAFAVHPEARGRGIAARMCAYAMGEARTAGFRAMQFNFVVATNPAVALWLRQGFEIVGTVPGAFRDPAGNHVDVHVMHCML